MATFWSRASGLGVDPGDPIDLDDWHDNMHLMSIDRLTVPEVAANLGLTSPQEEELETLIAATNFVVIEQRIDWIGRTIAVFRSARNGFPQFADVREVQRACGYEPPPPPE